MSKEIIGKETSEAIEKEGIDIDGDQSSAVDAKQAEDSSTPNSQEVANSPEGGAKAPVTESEPWHKSERFRKLTERARQSEERLAKLQESYERVLENQARVNGLFGDKQGGQSQLSNEDRQAILKLASYMKEVPEAAEMLGIGRTSQLEQKLQDIQNERVKESGIAERSRVLDKYSTQYGISQDELLTRFEEFIENNDFYANSSYKPGMVESAFKAMLFDQQSELAERKVNSKLIEEKKKKINAGMESPVKGERSIVKAKPKRMGDFIDQLVRDEGGGEISFD